MTATTRPVDRYGAPRRWTRPLGVGVAVLLALVGGSWLVWAALHHAQPEVAGRLRTYRLLDGGAVSATIDVQRQPGVGAVCVLVAQAADHFVVGERLVRIPPGPSEELSLTYRIATERPATNAALERCTPRAG